MIYVEGGNARLTVTASNGKEATLGLLGPGAFLGEEVLAGQTERPATATAITDDDRARSREARDDPASGHTACAVRTVYRAHAGAAHPAEADLIDQLFNSCEKRVARTLLLLAGYGERAQPQHALPQVSQEVIAEMVGTTRSRVNLFMNKFKRLGFIEYEDGLKVNPSLMTSSCTTKRGVGNMRRALKATRRSAAVAAIWAPAPLAPTVL